MRFLLSSVLIFAIFSCKTFDETVEHYDVEAKLKTSSIVEIDFPYIKPSGITDVYYDSTTLQILEIIADGRKIRGSWCMCGLPEPKRIELESMQKKEFYTSQVGIFNDMGFFIIHSGVGKRINPREYNIPKKTKKLFVKYKIKLSEVSYIGPYSALINFNFE